MELEYFCKPEQGPELLNYWLEERLKFYEAIGIPRDKLHVKDIPAADLEACKRHGWEVAGPEAYPAIFRKERGLSLRPPLAWELLLMEGCLRAIPAFMARHRPDDLSMHKMTIPVASGDLSLILSWVAE